MLLIGAILGVGALLGLGLRGDPRNLTTVNVRLWWLAPVALALQVLPVSPGEGTTRWLPLALLLGSYALLLVVVAANLRLRGFRLILLGLVMNAAVIGANQGMPVSASALEAVGHPEDIELLADAEEGAKHHLESDDDVLLPLADVIAVREPFNAIVSVGDVLLYSGVSVFLAMALLGRAVRTRRDREPAAIRPASWS